MGEANPKQDNAVDETFVDELKAGTELMHGQYTIESFLNAGGFGITYNARDSLDRRVVIKECFPGAFCRRSRYMVTARSRAHQNELQSIVRLFVQEAKSLSKLDHPNIVGVHNVFEENSTAYMALDFVEGRDLLDIIEDDDALLTSQQVETILREILGAIAFIHDQGILHRDISPDNILVDSNFHPVLIDFGAAREQATKQSRVLSALRVVKDGYSPQEFYIQGSDQGPYSDLYALGASFYHVIAGDVPPNSQARLAAIASNQPDPYEPLKGNVPGLSEHFLEAIDRSLAVLPKDRLQSAQDWLAMMDGNYDPIAVTVANTVRESKEATARAARTAPPKPYVPAVPKDVIDPDGAVIKKTKAGALLATTAVLALVAGAVVFVRMGGDDVADAADTPAAVETSSEAAEAAPVAAPDAVDVAVTAPVETDVEVEAEAEATVAEVAADVAPEATETPVEPSVPQVQFAEETEVAVEAEVAAEAAPAQEVVAEVEETVAVVEEDVFEVAPEDTFEVAVAEPSIESLSADTAAAEPEVANGEILDIFEAAAALANPEDRAVDDIAIIAEPVAEVVPSRAVSGEPTPIVGPVGAAEGVSSGPFDIDLSTLFAPWKPTLRPALRPEGLGVEPLVLASSSSVGGQVALAAAVGAQPGFPEILPEPVPTPSVPEDGTAPSEFASVGTSFSVPSMETLPLLPVSFVGPQGLPSTELPVYPFAAEVVAAPEPVAAPAVGESALEPAGPIQVLSTPVLPYNGLFSAELNETRIYSVNGVAVDSLVQFNDAVRSTTDLAGLTEIDVTIETGLVGQDNLQLQTLTLPVKQEVRLQAGPVFESVQVDGGWETRVASVPSNFETDLLVGDVVLAYVNTTERLTERTAIADLIERESAAGTTEFSFAVLRDGATWVANLTFENSTAAGQD